MQNNFINRKLELDILNRLYKSNKAELVIVYGRRRIGKTMLLNKFLEGKNGFYYLATEEDINYQIKELAEKTKEKTNIYGSPKFKEFFEVIAKRFSNERFVIILDKTQYLAKSYTPFTSVLQKLWDEHLSKSKVMLILSGSSIGFAKQSLLGTSSPLYGRRTSEIKIKEINITDYFRGWKKPNWENYLISGGVPYYWNFSENGVKDCLNNFYLGKPLYNEGLNIIKDELPNSRIYLSILSVLSKGPQKLSGISSELSIEMTTLSKYIAELKLLEIIDRESPVFGGRNVYYIKDNLLATWFLANKILKEAIESRYEMNEEDWVLVRKQINTNLGFFFEKEIKKIIIQKNILNFKPDKIGRQWGKTEKTKETYEIDIVAINKKIKELVLGEVKWKEKVNAEELASKLHKKSVNIKWLKEERNEYYILFAKSFKNKITKYAGIPVKCFDLKELQK